jgi:type IX secretion system PorP/SprF family membrane protein
MLLKKNWRFIILLLWSTRILAQDSYFSQFYSAPLFLSPSLAGSSGGARLVGNYRNQWPGIDNSFQTYAFSADFYLDRYRSGIGALFVTDKQGSANLNNTYVGLQYSYRIKLGRSWQVVPGLQFSMGQKSLNWDKLIFVDKIETGSPSNALLYMQNSKITYTDFASSLFFYSYNFWIGFSADHLLNPDYSFTESGITQTIKIVNFGGMNLWGHNIYRNLDPKSASLCYRFEYQNNFKQLDLGVYWYAPYIDLGIWYRGIPVFNNNVEGHFIDNDALIFLIGFTKGSFRCAYSYDLQISDMAGSGNGAHEISLIYEIAALYGHNKSNLECFSKQHAVKKKGKGIKFNKSRPRKLEII